VKNKVRTAKTATRLYMVLLDGRPHHASEFMGLLMDGVNPAVAARAYIYMRRRISPNFDPDTIPQEQVVDRGKRRVVMCSLLSLVREGFISINRLTPHNDKPEDDVNNDFEVSLTQEGFDHLAKPSGKQACALGSVFNLMREMLRQRRITLSVTLEEPTYTTPDTTSGAEEESPEPK
jgi:hypothetical protein